MKALFSGFLFLLFFLLALKDSIVHTVFYIGASEMLKSDGKSVKVVGRQARFTFSKTSLNVSFIYYYSGA